MAALEIMLQGPLALALLAVAFGALVHGTLGIGFPMVATPIIALATDVRTAIVLTLMPTLVVNVISIIRGGNWGESLGRHWPIALYTLVGSVIGTELLLVSDPAPFRLVLAGAILFYLGSSAVGRMSWTWIHRYPRWAGLGFGSLAGILVGMVNVAVPLLIIYFSELRLAPLAMVQTLNLCFLGGKTAQIATFGLSGQVTETVLMISAPLALTAGAMLFVGMAIRRRVDAETYRHWLRGMLLVIALVLCAQFFAGI